MARNRMSNKYTASKEIEIDGRKRKKISNNDISVKASERYLKRANKVVDDIRNAVKDAFQAGYIAGVEDYMKENEAQWIPQMDCKELHMCSRCHHEAVCDTDYGEELTEFCPYCGAKMTHF